MAAKITETEAEEQLRKLNDAIRAKAGVEGWDEVIRVLDLIQYEIDEGRPEVRKVSIKESALEDPVSGKIGSSQTTSAELMGSRPYAHTEALDMTVEALALAFVAPTQMASKIRNTISKISEKENIDINFFDPLKSDDDSVRTYAQEDINMANEQLQPLADALSKMSDEIGLKERNISLKIAG